MNSTTTESEIASFVDAVTEPFRPIAGNGWRRRANCSSASSNDNRQQQFDSDLAMLLTAWRAHQNLRAADATVADLFASRARLDQARAAVTRSRGRLHESSACQPGPVSTKQT